jgi:hypothetical protein
MFIPPALLKPFAGSGLAGNAHVTVEGGYRWNLAEEGKG